MQEAKVAAQQGARDGGVPRPRGEDVEGAGQQERELQRRAQGDGLAGCRVPRRREERRVEGVVLLLLLSPSQPITALSVEERGYREGRRKLTLRPMTPRQAMAGIEVAICETSCILWSTNSLFCSPSRGLPKEVNIIEWALELELRQSIASGNAESSRNCPTALRPVTPTVTTQGR